MFVWIKKTYNRNFIYWDKVDKDALCDAMDNILGEAVKNGNSFQYISEVIQSLYETFPGLKEYKAERFKQACPSGEVFGPYMPHICFKAGDQPKKEMK